MEEKKNEPVIKNFEENKPLFTRKLTIIFLVVILIGIGTGYLLGSKGSNVSGINIKQAIESGSIKKGTTEGASDMSSFKDIAEGTLKEGGIDGEGAFHLERPGGESQNVYLTSSIVDLSKYVGKKTKVWGQTQKAQKAGWLMDVGKIEVL